MRRVLIGVMLAALSAFFIGGCGVLKTTGPSVCDTVPEGQTSILCAAAEKVGQPLEAFGKTLEIANFGVLVSKPSAAKDVMNFLDYAEEYIVYYRDKGMEITPNLIIDFLFTEYRIISPEAAAALAIIDPMAGVKLDIPMVMSEFDIDIILGHIAKQKRIVTPFIISQ